MRRLVKVVCPCATGWSKVPGIFFNPGVCPVMRFVLLIPAITALGITGCQVPPPVTSIPTTGPTTGPTTTIPAASSTSDTAVDTAIDDSTSTSDGFGADITVAETVSPAAQTPSEESTTSDETQGDATLQPETAEQPAEAPVTELADAPVQTPGETSGDGSQATGEDSHSEVGSVAPVSAPVSVGDDAAQPATDPVATADSAAETVAPDSEMTGDATATELALAAPPPPPPPPPPPELAPEALIGFDAPALQQRLGDADFKRREGSVETWQYRFQTCVVDYFLYPENADPAVRNWAWRSPVIGGRLDAKACRRALAERDQNS